MPTSGHNASTVAYLGNLAYPTTLGDAFDRDQLLMRSWSLITLLSDRRGKPYSTVYITACDLRDSFSLDMRVEITGHIYLSIHVSTKCSSCLLYFPTYDSQKGFRPL